MSRNLILLIENLVKSFENMLMPFGGHQPALSYALQQQNNTSNSHPKSFSLRDLLGDGMLWAVPKHRRSVEKRLNRKFGHPEYVWKPLKEKRNLRTCQKCGHNYELGLLCPFCYNKVRQETQLMQDKIQEQLGLQAIEQEVVVLYEGEKAEQTADDLKGKRIVEMPKPRPMWFTKNLLQKSTTQSSDTKEVKPTELA
ncbi:hypothetical protein KR222_008758 [Zaprionus bogoriensis]|nr:hypothetical protein KR222_008758 [Zaprionus bogoriensis]